MLINSTLAVLEAGVIGLLVMYIVRRRKAEKLLRRAHEQSCRIVESSPIGICVISNRRFVYVNQSYVRMFGYSSGDDICGRLVEELYAPEERQKQRRFARDRVAGIPTPTAYDTKGLRKDGSQFDVAAWVSMIEHNSTPSSLGFVIDRTVEKQLRRELENKNRMEAVGTLAGGIAHDFNNILTAIIGYAELASFRAGDNSEIRDDLRQVKQAGKRAKDLVQQILAFSRNREEKLKIICLASIVREVLGLVRVALPSSIEIRTALQSESLVNGDSTQIHQLLMNLCANAEYAMRSDGGKLEISLALFKYSDDQDGTYVDFDPGEYICLAVADNGPGIPESLREKIFEPFYTTKPAGEGSGMGLAQVHGIVASHQGYIRLEENRPHGTRFKIFFPAVSGSAGATPIVAVEVPRGTEKILVIDDEDMVLQVFSQILANLGYDVTTSQASLDALKLVNDDPSRFDLVLSDMTLPDMTGDKLAVAMLQIRPDLPFILCTGFHATVNEAEASKVGVRAFLEKPVGREKLARTVRNLLDEAKVSTVACS